VNYERLYQYRFRDVDQASRLAVWSVVALDVYRRLGDPDVVLDPAAGLGEFICSIPASERWAVDLVKYSEKVDPSIKFIYADSLTVDLPEDYFDGVFISNCLEHLTSQNDVATFLERMYNCIRHDGRVAVLGPNFRHCSKEYFDCADHTLALTHVGIAEHLYAAGFEIMTCKSRYLPYSFRSRLPASARLTRWYLRTPFAQRLLGKQFLVIAQKQ
jgi:ubiquinone/menaquinone biosynthesis C-methylase UbiE